MHSELESAEIGTVVATLLGQHGPKWLCFIQGLLGDRADAEDVLQEAVRRMLARNRGFVSEHQVRMYLGRVIGNTAIDMYHTRRRERSRRVPLQESMCLTPDNEDPHGCMEQKENWVRQDRMVQLLQEGLATLPVKQHEALRLILLEPDATSIRGAGEISGIPYSTLRHRAIQGLSALRKFVHRSMRLSGKRSIRLLRAGGDRIKGSKDRDRQCRS